MFKVLKDTGFDVEGILKGVGTALKDMINKVERPVSQDYSENILENSPNLSKEGVVQRVGLGPTKAFATGA